MGRYDYNRWQPYVPVAERRRQAAKKIAKMKKAGRDCVPVTIAGRKIAATFWGEAWCKNLEAYSDYENRLPRGRTYVRNGSVVDLSIETGHIRALVSGSSIYEVEIAIKPLPRKRWDAIKKQCAGRIESLVELLRGAISKSVMEIVTRKGEGLFPSPREITLKCSCPDWATMCKHVAATLYGVGARLDHEPALLFTLRGVDPNEMVAAAVGQVSAGTGPRTGRTLANDELSSIFGVEIEMDGIAADDASSAPPVPATKKKRAVGTRKKAASQTSVKKAIPEPPDEKSSEDTIAKKKTVKKATTRKPAARKTTTRKPATRNPLPKSRTKR
jgi:uncharacterized Zn finger protein